MTGTRKPDNPDLIIVVKLTQRELDVLRLLARGYSAKQVALHLAIAPRTVSSHIDKLRLKTRTRNSTHLVVQAIKLGVLEAN